MLKNQKIVFYILALLLILITSTGCIAGNKEVIDTGENDWQNEVLLAQECGMDGLRCCTDKEPSCQHGQECCTNPNNIKMDMCADNCVCGELKKFCCKDEPKCDRGLACGEDHCMPCGGEDQPCCAEEEECSGDLVCHKKKCVECGHPGTPCCLEGADCADSGATDATHTECRNGVCVYCGTAGKVSCKSGPACLKGNLANNDRCWRCGGFNLPCCDIEAGAEYECDPGKDLKCNLGFCSKVK